jgi:hypothetical protein
MADEQGDIGVESATAGVEEVRLDESGQPISKSALKKLLKKELADKKKAEKAAAMVSVCNRYSKYLIRLHDMTLSPQLCMMHQIKLYLG